MGSDESYLNERINVQHKCLGPTDDELIDTCNSMRPRNQVHMLTYVHHRTIMCIFRNTKEESVHQQRMSMTQSAKTNQC